MNNNDFIIGDWHVIPLRGVINGPDGSRRITPKSMDVLQCMARHNGEVVSRETFVEEVWDGRAFSDDPLNKCIAELRKQLGDRPGTGGYIETVPKRGYRLAVDVQPVGSEPPAGETRQTRSYLRIGAFAVLVALAAIGAWRLSMDLVPDGSISIAVLPFQSVQDPAQTYFADGVHEELVAELSRISAFDVRSRASTLQFRDRSIATPDIAEQLRVDLLVDGSIRQDGDRIRVTAQLIQGEDDASLWSATVEKSRSIESLFEIQEEFAEEIANALRVRLDRSSHTTLALPTDSFDAYDAFLLGKFHYRRKLPGDIEKSVVEFERAVQLDPQFAIAWDWLAYAYNHAATALGYLAPREAYPRARAAALRALELQADLATAMSILGYIRAVHDRDWVGAVADLERAYALDPADPGTAWSLAHVYSLVGRHDDAIGLVTDFAERGSAQDRGRNLQEIANRLIDAGRYTDVLETLDKAYAAGAEPGDIADSRGVALVGLGRIDEALASFEFAVEARKRAAGTLARYAWVLAKSGRADEASQLLAELESRQVSERISRLVFATAYTGVGETHKALEEIDAAIQNGGREVLGLPNDPFLADLRETPEFQQMVASLQLPD